MMTRTRTDPRTEVERRAISEGRKRAAAQLRDETARTAELMFRLLLERGIATTREKGVALAALDRALANRGLPASRRRALERYRDALDAGRRIKVAMYPAEVHTPPFVR